MVILKTLVGSLASNVNEITFTDAIINSNSIIEVYYNSNDIYTVETWQRENTIGIVTSDHDFPVSVKVLINNVVAFEPYDDTSLVNRIDGLADRMTDAEEVIIGLTGRVNDAEDDIDTLETAMTGKQDILTAGTGITIENNVISALSSTVYSTTERVVGKWIDGSDLYQCTFIFESIADGTTFFPNFMNISIKFVQGCFRFRASKNNLTLWSRAFDSNYRANVNGLGIDNNRLYIDCSIGSSRTGNLDLELTLYYTKTT